MDSSTIAVVPPGGSLPSHSVYLPELPEYHIPPNSRFCTKIVCGLVVLHSEALKWYTKNIGLSDTSFQPTDLTIFYHMLTPAYDYGCKILLVVGQDTEPGVADTLFITKTVRGEFLHTGWTGPEGPYEVIQDDLKNIYKPGEVEDKLSKVISKDFGR